MTDAVEVQITFPDESVARTTAAELVRARLAACCQIVPVASLYAWEGNVVDDAEWLLTAKTLTPALPALEATIRAGHPYDLPQITALPIAWASADYLAWIADTVRA